MGRFLRLFQTLTRFVRAYILAHVNGRKWRLV